MTHVAFFGDGEHAFALPADLIIELERKTGAGIGTLCKRVFAGQFALGDLIETIRLGLIGGGTTPADAAALVNIYAKGRPLAENFPLAVAILERAYFGEPANEDAPANG
jgi:hypothetical protein